MEFVVLEVLNLSALSFMEFGAWNVDACRAARVKRCLGNKEMDCIKLYITFYQIDSCRYQGKEVISQPSLS